MTLLPSRQVLDESDDVVELPLSALLVRRTNLLGQRSEPGISTAELDARVKLILKMCR